LRRRGIASGRVTGRSLSCPVSVSHVATGRSLPTGSTSAASPRGAVVFCDESRERRAAGRNDFIVSTHDGAPMTFIQRIKRGEGPLWGTLKRAAKAVLTFHLPVSGITRPVWRGLYAFHVAIREGWIWLWRFCWNEPLFRSQCTAVGRGLWME